MRSCLTAAQIAAKLEASYGPAPALPSVRKLQLLPYQLAALYHLARPFNTPGARFLEIGTGHGASGFMLAKAAPEALITSLTTAPQECVEAERLWRGQGLTNIFSSCLSSWDLLEDPAARTTVLDLVFVDGDHNRIARDLPWFNRLRPGGLFLCHDYSQRASAIVFEQLNLVAARLGRSFDVLLVDEQLIGMAGFYRREGEVL